MKHKDVFIFIKSNKDQPEVASTWPDVYQGIINFSDVELSFNLFVVC